MFKVLLPRGEVDAATALVGENGLLSDEQKEVRAPASGVVTVALRITCDRERVGLVWA